MYNTNAILFKPKQRRNTTVLMDVFEMLMELSGYVTH